ncbi:PUB domain containing protein [Nitzschia inconspicua]|uniref:PUB domain containing protein n=1 Tax=Nitzschia inconspicua TaxID=303405 RepID=A0A9K3PYK9_9STRA|nr:PUB domain containing protein [Nitzschia inconspicua]
MQVFCTITAKNGERVPIEVSDDVTPTMLRQQVSTATKIPLVQLRLIFRGRMIKDDDTKLAVEEYKLEPDCVLHCMGKPEETTTTTTTSINVPTTPVNSFATASTMVSSAASVPPTPPPTVATTAGTVSTGPPPTTVVSAAIVRLRQNNPPSIYETALTTLDKILKNIVTHPMEEKYRKVKRQNPAFSKRLGGLVGGHDCMLAVGFTVETDADGAEIYQLHASAEQWPKLVQAKTEISNAAEQAKQQQQQLHTTFSATGPGTNSSSPFGASAAPGGLPPGMIPPPMDPAMRNAMSQMFANPQALQATLQNPMIQQMMQNNPNVTPMMRQQIETIANNPAMIDQIAQQMQNPVMRAQIEAMMAADGARTGIPGFMPNASMGGNANPSGTITTTTTTTTTTVPRQAVPPPQGNDQDQTEEEMIAEAIRRSLEES